MSTATTASPGEILADAVYTLEEFGKRMRLGTAAVRTARRQGLIVRHVGRRSYVIGRDFIAYLENLKPVP